MSARRASGSNNNESEWLLTTRSEVRVLAGEFLFFNFFSFNVLQIVS